MCLVYERRHGFGLASRRHRDNARHLVKCVVFKINWTLMGECMWMWEEHLRKTAQGPATCYLQLISPGG